MPDPIRPPLTPGLTPTTPASPQRNARAIEAQRAFFEKHVAPWMGRLFADMESATNARFYRPVGTLGRLFLEIEAEALTFAN